MTANARLPIDFMVAGQDRNMSKLQQAQREVERLPSRVSRFEGFCHVYLRRNI